jgi:ERCC4-type nuclease
MIQIDERIGSRELESLILSYGAPTKITKLKYGDFVIFSKNGPDQQPCSIAFERKKVLDLVASIESGRLSGLQLPGMLQTYDFVYLIVEGEYRPDPGTGRLHIKSNQGRYKSTVWRDQARDYRMIDAYLTTLRLKTPVQVIRTKDPDDTACQLYMTWHWFNSKRWDSHKSHIDFEPDPRAQYAGIMSKPSWFRQVVSRFPGIGMERSKQAAKLWGSSLHQMVNASVEELALLDGISVKRAQDIWRRVRNINGLGEK